MAEFGTIWRMAVATLAVWRLSRLMFQDGVPEVGSSVYRVSAGSPLGGRFLGGRMIDLVYWLHVWLSAQTAVWVACGFAGVFLSWVAASGVSRVIVGGAAVLSSPLEEAGTGAGDTAMPNQLREAAQ